jgi:hypothetical protein
MMALKVTDDFIAFILNEFRGEKENKKKGIHFFSSDTSPGAKM